MSRQWKYVNILAHSCCVARIPLNTRQKRKRLARRAAALGYTESIGVCSLLRSFYEHGNYKLVAAELRDGRVHKCNSFKPMSLRRWLNKSPNSWRVTE